MEKVWILTRFVVFDGIEETNIVGVFSTKEKGMEKLNEIEGVFHRDELDDVFFNVTLDAHQLAVMEESGELERIYGEDFYTVVYTLPYDNRFGLSLALWEVK